MLEQKNNKFFTKSAFKQALECPASLYYYYDNEHYANQNNEDDFLQALAEGGQQVGDLAKVYYQVPDECDIKELKYEPALARTKELFQRENVTIAEAAFSWKNCFVRADIIKKEGKSIKLIEVKATSWNPDEDSFLQKRNPNCIASGIRPYLYDVAFQKYVIQKALGAEYTVTAYLMMADKRTTAQVNGMNPMFKVVNEDGRVHIKRSSEAASLAGMEQVLNAFPVDDLCQRVISGETSEQREVMSGMLFVDFVEEMSSQYVKHKRHYSPLGAKCFKCPFVSNQKTEGLLDGKKECWKEQANFTERDFGRPLVGDLWGQYIKRDDFIKSGKYFLEDLTPSDFNPTAQKPGLNHIERKLLQIGLATGNEDLLRPFQKNIHNGVYLDIPNLKRIMEKDWHYPLHMIDFETSAAPIPFYKGMHPYEAVAFQFSHHIIEKDGTIRHAGQYLNDKKQHFPNFEFVRELKHQLDGDDGTVFRYANHENTILRAIRKQLVNSQENDKEELIDFIDSITHSTSKEEKHVGNRDMVDLLLIVLNYYYHPSMKGSNSIKAVLPAILNSSAKLREKYSRPIYGKEITSINYTPEEAFSWITTNPDGTVDNPYHHLKEIASFLGVSQNELEQYDNTSTENDTADEGMKDIQNGGAALAAYTKLQFADEKWTKAIEKALYRYCELDTMSMVFIWEYFHEMTGV